MIAKLANFIFHEHPKNEIHIFTVIVYYDAMCDSDVAIFSMIKSEFKAFHLTQMVISCAVY